MNNSRFLGGVGAVLILAGIMLAGAEYETNAGLIKGSIIAIALMLSGALVLRKTSH